MSERTTTSSGGSGCGCITIIATILVLWALFFGLTVNGKTLDIDIFPPGVTYQ